MGSNKSFIKEYSFCNASVFSQDIQMRCYWTQQKKNLAKTRPYCKFLPHENCRDWEFWGPCRENLHYLWKRAVQIAGKPHENYRSYNHSVCCVFVEVADNSTTHSTLFFCTWQKALFLIDGGKQARTRDWLEALDCLGQALSVFLSVLDRRHNFHLRP